MLESVLLNKYKSTTDKGSVAARLLWWKDKTFTLDIVEKDNNEGLLQNEFTEYNDFDSAWSTYTNVILGSEYAKVPFKSSLQKKKAMKLLEKAK